jgi:hypothetical protein
MPVNVGVLSRKAEDRGLERISVRGGGLGLSTGDTLARRCTH